MKILSPPESDKWKYWWAGRKHTCSNCRSVLELEKSDVPRKIELAGHSSEHAYFGCQHCGNEFQLARNFDFYNDAIVR